MQRIDGRRAALYARFSTDLQNDRSIEDQLALCNGYAVREGLTVTHRYEDRAKSSATLFGRDGLLALIADAKERVFDVIVVEALDRISRNPADLHPLFQTLDFVGIRVLEVHRGQADALTVGIQGLFGQMFLDQLKEKTRRGLAGVVRDGRSAGGRAYGYATVPGQPGQLTVVEGEAKIIRRIFDEYIGGATTREIVARLNAEGIPAPRGSVWRSTVLTGNAARGYGILWNDLYDGKRIWNRVRMVRDPETGKRVSRTNPESEWQIEAAEHLRIVPPATFAAVRKLRLARMELRGEKRKRPARPLSGLMACDCCGGSIVIRARRPNGAVQAACSNAVEAGTCTERKSVRLDQIETAVFAELAQLLREPDVMGEYLKAYHEERQRLAREKGRTRATLERSAAKARGAFDRAHQLYIDGVTDGPKAKANILELRLAAERAEAALAEADPPEVLTLHPDATNRYLAALTDLAPSLSDLDTPEARKAMDTIREWISEIRVRREGDEVHVTVYGYLAALVEPSTRRGEMVAWGGLEPPTPAL